MSLSETDLTHLPASRSSLAREGLDDGDAAVRPLLVDA